MDRMDKLTTLFESDEQLYFCVGLIILVGAIVIICAMVNDYREYLDAHLRTRFRLREFLREEKFYFFPDFITFLRHHIAQIENQ